VFGKKRRKLDVSGRNEFSTAIDIVKRNCSNIENVDEKLDFLRYALFAVKTDLISSYRAKQFYKEIVNNQINIMPDFENSENGEIELELESAFIFTIPWRFASTLNHIKNIKINQFKEDTNNHFATYYPCMDICYVYNGIHSTTMGKYYKKGIIHAKIYDMQKAFNLFYTDGEKWYYKENSYATSNVFDYRLAIIFEICRMIYEMENDI
jgi:hypothetical protein